MTIALAEVPYGTDTAALAAEASEIVLKAQAITIASDDTYRSACEFGKGIKSLQKRIAEFFEPHKRRAKAVHSALCDDEKSQLVPTEKAEIIIKSKVMEWRIAEAKREADLQRQREELARKQEEERRLQEALDAEEEGDTAAATAILEEPIETPIVAMPRLAPKVAGVASVKRWTYRENTVDVAAIIRHIAGLAPDAKLAHPELVNLLAIQSTTARQLITAMKDNFRVPGIDAYQADGVSFGSK